MAYFQKKKKQQLCYTNLLSPGRGGGAFNSFDDGCRATPAEIGSFEIHEKKMRWNLKSKKVEIVFITS